MNNKNNRVSEEKLTVKELLSQIEEGADAVFLPSKLHGCEDQIYIIYLNPQACGGKGCFEIEIIDYERILDLYDTVCGDTEMFFNLLPDKFQGEWKYCDSRNECFQDYAEEYFHADFLFGRDGGNKEELEFIVAWARKRQAQVSGR